MEVKGASRSRKSRGVMPQTIRGVNRFGVVGAAADTGSRRGEPPASRSPRLEARAPSARRLVFRGESVSGGSRLDGALQDRPLLDDE